MKILIITGHGNGDPGACAFGYSEAALVREIAPILKNKLDAYATVDIFDTSKNMYQYLKKNSFNFKNYNYVLELHFNAGVGDYSGNGMTTGAEVLVHPFESNTGVENKILENICGFGFKNRGIKQRNDLQNMNICRNKQGVKYALLEVCFIDDLDDINLYLGGKDQVITGIANGIIAGFNLGQPIQIQKEEEEIVTQEQFNEMMNIWIADSANKQPGDWSYAARTWAENNGLVKGDDQGRMLWKKNLTREEFVTVLSRLFDKDDSAVSSWSTDARNWAESIGLVSGDGNNKGWLDYITKEQLVTILYRFKELMK